MPEEIMPEEIIAVDDDCTNSPISKFEVCLISSAVTEMNIAQITRPKN